MPVIARILPIALAHAALLSSPLEAVAPPSLRRGAGSRLREIDELVRAPESRGFTIVQAPGSVLDALGKHVARRARALGRPMVCVAGLPTDDAWRELASRLGATAVSDPIA